MEMNAADAAAAEERILDDLIHTVHHVLGLRILEATPIRRGWLNLKWKIRTDSGTFLLKQYNKERYKLYASGELKLALSRQAWLHAQGLPCPRLLSHEGSFLLESGQGELFLVMEHCSGSLIAPGKANALQIYDLGRSAGKMHRLLNGKPSGSPGSGSPQFMPPSREERTAHWSSIQAAAAAAGKAHLLAAIEAQIKATEEVTLDAFGSLPTGWAHRDLWADNLLFGTNRLTAILDFDRLRYDYPPLDAARAVMSCALDGEQLNTELASAFMEGYREEQPAVEGYLASALQLLWYMESTWWIHDRMDQHSLPPARFAQEMIWLAKHYKLLPELLCKW